MEPSKKLKEEAKELKIPHYWNYSKENLLKLVLEAKRSKVKSPAKPAVPRPPVKAQAKPKAQVKNTDNKKEILDHITKCNILIVAEKKNLKGPKAQHYTFLLNRALVDLKKLSDCLSKIV